MGDQSLGRVAGDEGENGPRVEHPFWRESNLERAGDMAMD